MAIDGRVFECVGSDGKAYRVVAPSPRPGVNPADLLATEETLRTDGGLPVEYRRKGRYEIQAGGAPIELACDDPDAP